MGSIVYFSIAYLTENLDTSILALSLCLGKSLQVYLNILILPPICSKRRSNTGYIKFTSTTIIKISVVKCSLQSFQLCSILTSSVEEHQHRTWCPSPHLFHSVFTSHYSIYKMDIILPPKDNSHSQSLTVNFAGTNLSFSN